MCRDMARLGGSTSIQKNFFKETVQQSCNLHCPLCSSGSNGVKGWVFLLPSCGRSLGDLEWVTGILFSPSVLLRFCVL